LASLPPIQPIETPTPPIIDENKYTNFSNLIPNKPVKPYVKTYVFIPKILNPSVV